MIAIPPNRATRLGLNILILLAVVVALRQGQSIFIPLTIALLLAAVLGPLALWLHQRLRFPWTLACLTSISGLVVLNLLVTLVFAMGMARLLQVLPRPDDETAIINLYSKFRLHLDRLSPFPLDPEMFPESPEKVGEIKAFQNFTDFATKEAPELLRKTFFYGSSWLWELILILFILLFLLLEGGMLTRRVVEIFGPSEEVQNKARTVLRDMANHVKTYLVWRTIINFWLAIIVGCIYSVAGLHQPWTWAILLAILNYVPYLGPLVAGIPPVVDAIVSTSPLGGLIVLVLYTSIIIVEGYLIVPLLMGRTMDLNATTVMLACLFWELVWGTLGLFLAMPLMAALKAICFNVPGWRPWANLMSTSEAQPHPILFQPIASAGSAAEQGTLEAASSSADNGQPGQKEVNQPDIQAT